MIAKRTDRSRGATGIAIDPRGQDRMCRLWEEDIDDDRDADDRHRQHHRLEQAEALPERDLHGRKRPISASDVSV